MTTMPHSERPGSTDKRAEQTIVCLLLIFEKDFIAPFIYVELHTPRILFRIWIHIVISAEFVGYVRIILHDMLRKAMLSCGTVFLAR